MFLTIRVIPKAGRSEYRYDKARQQLKIYLKSPPERGAANDELITALTKWLKIPQHTITIVSGATARTKRLKIDANLTHEQIFERLGISIQQSIF